MHCDNFHENPPLQNMCIMSVLIFCFFQSLSEKNVDGCLYRTTPDQPPMVATSIKWKKFDRIVKSNPSWTSRKGNMGEKSWCLRYKGRLEVGCPRSGMWEGVWKSSLPTEEQYLFFVFCYKDISRISTKSKPLQLVATIGSWSGVVWYKQLATSEFWYTKLAKAWKMVSDAYTK